MTTTIADTHYLEESKLLEAMHGRSMTGRWDVLVSYKAEKLSTLLAESWAKDQRTDTIDVADKDITFGSKCSYHLDLGNPLLAFEASDSSCTASLTIPISGTVTVGLYIENDDGTYLAEPYKVKKQDVSKDTFHLKVSVPLKSVAGDVNAAQIDTHGEASNTVILLGQNEAEKAHIVLHFSSEKAVYSVDRIKPASPETPAVPNFLSDATKSIQKWFSNKDNVNAIEYRLATVKAIKDPTDGSALLKPESFIFGSNGDVLCIYIQTEGSSSKGGDSEAKFTAKDGSTIPPIPLGSSASIIISHQLLHEKVFLPQLQKYQTDNGITDPAKAVTWSNNDKGFTYQFRLRGDFDVDIKGEPDFSVQVIVPKKTVHLNDNVTTLNIEDNQAIFECRQSYEVKWTEFAISFGGGRPSECSADLDVEMINQNTTVANVENNDHVALDLSISKDSFAYKEKKTGSLYKRIDNDTFTFQYVSLKLPNLDFIAAESVLAPGMTMVNVKALHIPYDLILTGDMVEHATA